MPTNKKPFQKEAMQFVKMLIRQRRYLNRTGRSKGRVARVQADVDFIDRIVQMNDYRNDRQVAGFYSRHSQRILSLIPANKSLDTYLDKHYALLSEANKIIHHERSRTLQ